MSTAPRSYRAAQQGVTLIELVIAIALIGVAAAALITALATLTGRSVDPLRRSQATAIAEAYLEEILAKPFTDPSLDPTTGAACPGVAPANRADWDNICDYSGLPDTVVRDQTGTAIGGLSDYQVAVASSQAAGQGIAAADVLRVDVTVTDPLGGSTVLTGLRTRY